MSYGQASVPMPREGAEKSSLSWPQILLRVLLVLSVLETDRSNMIFSTIIARFKDLDITLFFLSMVAVEGWRLDRSFFRRNAYGWLLLYVVFSFPVSVYSGQTQYGQVIQLDKSFAWATYLRMVYFCLLMYFLPRYFSRFPSEAQKLARLFVISCVVFVLFNVAAYFYHFPFMKVFRYQPGRISGGYPTSDALMLVFAIVANFLFTRRMGWRAALTTVILILGIAGNLTASGAICLACLGLLYALLNFTRRPAFVVSFLLGAVAIIGVAGYVAYQLLLMYSPLSLDLTISLIEAKLSTDRGAGGGTFAIRLRQYADALRYMENPFDRFFGLGAHYGYVEIQYLHVLLAWGIVGGVLFGLTFYQNIASALACNRKFSLYYSLVWGIAGMVLITTYLFPLFVPFAFLVTAGSVVAFPRAEAVIINKLRA